ncbi:hypothetical protein [Pannus brasiliensis]
MLAGFCLSAYAIVANDALQTLGTFISANEDRPWWVLWLYTSFILATIFIAGWYFNRGDVAYGRLAIVPFPETFTWIYIIPPLAILILTSFGIPVSTTFLILTVFAPQALNEMLSKSAWGYLLAIFVGFLLYTIISRWEMFFLETVGKEQGKVWIILQWISSGFLWSQWLVQDFANIFAYLPRELSIEWLLGSLVVMLSLQAIVFINHGGRIEKIVTDKTNTHDPRSATIINFIYASLLLFFVSYNHIPMSTTWVFLGLLGGREIALTIDRADRSLRETGKIVSIDILKAAIGTGVSVAIALTLPLLNS